MASLKKITEEFIEKKGKHKVIKAQSNKDAEKKRQNVHLSKQTIYLLWLNRTETGETISSTIDRLVLENLTKKYKK